MNEAYERMNHDDAIVSLQDACKVYNRRQVIHGLNVSVAERECVALIGKNGSGKSTLLRLLSGLTRLTTGQRTLGKKVLSMGYVPERFPALPFTPYEYLNSVGSTRGMDKDAIISVVQELLELLGLDAYGGVRMSQFSKGMLQKVNLIQAVMGQPELLLLDEPLSGLDAPTQSHIVRFLLEMKRRGTAIVMSVHEPQLIERIADRILMMETGRIIREESGFRKVKMFNKIVFGGLTPPLRKALFDLPGFQRWESEQSGGEIHVSSEASDNAIRLILDGGGSIISVQRSEDVEVNLGEWLKPAAARG